MRESQTVLGWINEGRKEGIKEGRVEGIREGIKEGRKEGQLATLRENVQLLLEDRFGPLSQDLAARIATMEDSERLKAALLQTLHITSLDAFSL
jgi:flagellar biosynthesis/type III secretory pathway protein FliH